MVSLSALYLNTSNLIFIVGVNGIRGRFGGINGNGYSGPPHNKLVFTCTFLIIFLYVKYIPVKINVTLEIIFVC